MGSQGNIRPIEVKELWLGWYLFELGRSEYDCAFRGFIRSNIDNRNERPCRSPVHNYSCTKRSKSRIGDLYLFLRIGRCSHFRYAKVLVGTTRPILECSGLNFSRPFWRFTLAATRRGKVLQRSRIWWSFCYSRCGADYCHYQQVNHETRQWCRPRIARGCVHCWRIRQYHRQCHCDHRGRLLHLSIHWTLDCPCLSVCPPSRYPRSGQELQGSILQLRHGCSSGWQSIWIFQQRYKLCWPKQSIRWYFGECAIRQYWEAGVWWPAGQSHEPPFWFQDHQQDYSHTDIRSFIADRFQYGRIIGRAATGRLGPVDFKFAGRCREP